MPSMLRIDSTLTTLGLAAILAIGVSAAAIYFPEHVGLKTLKEKLLTNKEQAKEPTAVVAQDDVWSASAPGRVKPKSGEIEVKAELRGPVVSVFGAANDTVRKGDPIAFLKTDDVLARMTAALAEVAVRVAERDEEPEENQLTVAWRKALDDLAAANRSLHAARVAFDETFVKYRDGRSNAGALKLARENIERFEEQIITLQKDVDEAAAAEGLPLPNRLDSGLAIARSDLKLVELAYDKTRVRAPSDGTILRFDAKLGQTVSPVDPAPVALIGDMSSLIVTAEVEERDMSNVQLGQSVIVKSNALEGQDFEGKVTRIAPRVGRPGLGLRGRNDPRDVEILEVEIELDGAPPLLSGMRVDVFFKPREATKAAANVIR